jgi:cytochrome c-type biogenesis protein CcmE
MTPATQKRLAAVGAVLVASAAVLYMAFGGIGQNLVYYWDATQLLAKAEAARGATIRLGGMVQKGTVEWNPNTLELKFKVGMQSELGGPAILVDSTGAPPQMFREGQGVVVEGQFDGQVFHSDRVLVKHSNDYHPPRPGERPREVYKTLMTK